MKRTVCKQNVGNDMSKDDFKVSFNQQFDNGTTRIKGSRTFKNNAKGFKQFVEWVNNKRCKDTDTEVRVTMEATGVYHEQLAYYLAENTDFRITIVLPNQSKAYMKSLNIKTKTYRTDAKALGQMGLERDLKQWTPLSQQMYELKQLARERVRLLRNKTRISNQLHALHHSYRPNKITIKRHKQLIKLINKQIDEIEKQIKTLIEADEVLKERVDKICKVKGLGIVTVATVIAETNGFALFTSERQLISFAGYDVIQNQSGTSVNGKSRISKKGNKYIRRAMYFPAITVVKHEEHFKKLYERVFDRTAIKMKGYVAVQRKLLVLIYTLFKKNEEYDANYHNKEQEQDNDKKNGVGEIQISPTLDDCSKATSLSLQI